ncbi:hypothetical protein [Aeromonas phage PVN02]|nr:hypothetical protein [Aeromonas phage PVN02]CAC9972278.1 hypothetical protein PVN02_00011 [Aeromonas phage PVN02]
MPVQQYKINTPDALPGQLYGLQQTRADIQTAFVEDADGIGFGVACKVGVGPRGVKLGGAAHVAGISVRQIDREPLNRPSNGTIVFKKGEALPLLSDGRINVRVAKAGTMKRGEPVFVDAATGEFGATGTLKCTNVVWGLSGTVAMGDVVHVVITNADVAAPAAPLSAEK